MEPSGNVSVVRNAVIHIGQFVQPRKRRKKKKRGDATVHFVLYSPPGFRSDVMSAFSTQWPEAAEFSQELLEYFIKDIEAVTADSTASDVPSSIETVGLLMR